MLVLGLTAGISTCMAMVGGLVLGFSASHAAALAARGETGLPFATRMRPQLAFNAGRIIGFGVLGALLGALGSTMSLPTRVTGVLVLVVAVVMFLLGVRLTGVSPRVAAWSPRLPAGLGRLLGIESAAEAGYSHWRTALVGAATFFLPCGFTQAAQVYALSTASPLAAGAIMATFAVGTTPGLLALASVPEVTTGRRQATVLRVVGVLVLAFALLNVSSSLEPARACRVARRRRPARHGIRQRHRQQRRADGAHDPGPGRLRARGHRALRRDADDVADRGHLEVRLQRGPAGARPRASRSTSPRASTPCRCPPWTPATVHFTCVMGMYSGNLIVVDPPAASARTGAGVPGARREPGAAAGRRRHVRVLPACCWCSPPWAASARSCGCAALCLSVVCAVLWVVARLELGRSFSVGAEAHELVTTGLYRHVRNPIYVFGTPRSCSCCCAAGLAGAGHLGRARCPCRWCGPGGSSRCSRRPSGPQYASYRASTWF